MSASPSPLSVNTLTLEVRPSAEETVVICHGRIVAENRDKFRETAKVLVTSTKRLTVDLGDVPYLDSAGIAALVELYISATGAQCRLKLINVAERPLRVLRLTKVAQIFDVQDDLTAG